jgi:hypothetical protein
MNRDQLRQACNDLSTLETLECILVGASGDQLRVVSARNNDYITEDRTLTSLLHKILEEGITREIVRLRRKLKISVNLEV